MLAGIVGAHGRVSLGQRAGARVRRLGDARDTATVTSRGPRQAHLEGFDLHANVWGTIGRAWNGCALYLAPAVRAGAATAAERRAHRAGAEDGVARRPAELMFEALELLERLAAMTPPPETNLLICHGVLASRAGWRARVVAYGRLAPEPTASTAPLAAGRESVKAKSGARAWS